MPTDPPPPARVLVVWPTRQRSIEQLHQVLSMLCNFIWTKQLRPGEHLWSIPVDPERDFDCILSDAFNELESARKQLQTLSHCSTCGLTHDAETCPRCEAKALREIATECSLCECKAVIQLCASHHVDLIGGLEEQS